MGSSSAMDRPGAGVGSAAREAGAELRGRGPALTAIAIGLIILAAATAGMLQGAEPFATWYYQFSWLGTLLAADGVVALTGGVDGKGSFLLLGRPAFLATMLGWSAVIWLFFELVNFRLENWYYVFLPHTAAARWTGILLGFVTVLPAVFVSEAALAGFGVARTTRWPELRVTPGLIRGMRIAGVLMLTLPLLWPQWFFPLIWGATTLLVEPTVYRRDPEHSLLADLERGRPGRILRLLIGGALIGLVWEMFNIGARGKWIYTVPGLEELKLFEMPLLGFLGFPPFALECYVLWQALLLGGVAVPRVGRTRPASLGTRAGAAVAATLFSALVIRGMEAHTISSYTPQLADLPGVPAPALRQAGFDAFSLAAATPEAVAQPVGAEPAEAAAWIEAARLAALRGIGTENARQLMALGIRSVQELAAAEPEAVAAKLEEVREVDVDPARVRVWVRAARRTLTES